MALDSNGLTIRSFDEVLTQLEDDERTNVAPNIDTRDDEYLGQMNAIISLMSQELEQTLQAVVDNLDPALAEGIWLDKLAAEKSVIRLIATPSSTAYQSFTATDGTVIPASTIIASTITRDEYQTTADITVDATSCQSSVISVNAVLNTTVYELTVNGTLYSFTSSGSATALNILQGLKNLVDADTVKTWTATVDSGNDTLTVATSNLSNINISLISYLSLDSVTLLGYVEAREAGYKVGIVNTVTSISSTVGGLISTYNTTDMVLGRDLETDEELRSRMYAASNIKSVAVPSAILSRIKNIEGVSVANLTENTTTVTVGGIPPHAYEVVISGGADDDIASELWLTKPAGIATHGSTAVNLADSERIQQTVFFTRPSAINLAFRAKYKTYDEEVLSSTIGDIIKASLVQSTGDLGIGVDVINQRYFGDIYSSSTGLSEIIIESQAIANVGDAPVDSTWDISTLDYCTESFSLSVSAQVSGASAITFSPNGIYMFVIDYPSDSIKRYTLSNPFDVSTAVYDGASKDGAITSANTEAHSLLIDPTGLKLYMLDLTLSRLIQYTMTTAYDVSTMTYNGTGDDLSIGALDGSIYGFSFNDDGSKAYFLGHINKNIYQHTLGTAWDTSTAVYDGAGSDFLVSGETTTPMCLKFKPDGSIIYIIDRDLQDIFQYDLGTAWDTSTAVYNSKFYDASAIDSVPRDIYINPIGDTLILLGDTNDSVYQFHFDTPWSESGTVIANTEYASTTTGDITTELVL